MTEQPLVLVINCGSSSLKFAVHALDRHCPLLSGLADRLGLEGATISFKDQSGKTVHDLKEPTHAASLEAVLEELAAHGWLNALAAVGHRVVHGGERFSSSVLVTPEVLARYRGHQPARAVTQSTRCTRHARRALAPRGAARRPLWTPPSTRPCRLPPISMLCPCRSIATTSCAVTAFTARLTAS